METGLIRQLKKLFLNELKLEWRNRYAINGIALQLLASVFIAYLTFQVVGDQVWNALFWLIILFTAVHAISKSFGTISEERLLYFHIIARPTVILISKMIVSAFLCISVGLLSLLVMSLFLGFPNISLGYFILVMLGFCIGIGFMFTSLSAIASKTKGGYVLVPVLGFPIIIPLILVCLRSSGSILLGITDEIWIDLSLIFLMDLIIFFLSTILFKFVWQD